ncbi:MAG: glycosyltransferase family 39 protein [Candidatus Curtissbacteria bacterium]|nr:glycosyltransferase family 39 protein [Candidatus Curtissbacteria bacterium]
MTKNKLFIRRKALLIRRKALLIRRKALLIRRKALLIRRKALLIRRKALLIRRKALLNSSTTRIKVLSKTQVLLFLAIAILSFGLRFYNLSENPPGLYWDEAAFGYNAYSILKTGHDEHGRFLPLFFESFGDWKLPGYFYLLVPSIKLFGLSELSVRFPSALLGSLAPLIFFLLIKKITKNTNLALTSMFFLAISPWHIQFSRSGFESTPSLFFVVSGVYLMLLGIETKKISILSLSFFLFVLSIYTYHASRIFVPLLVISIILTNLKWIKQNIKLWAFPALIGLILLIPMIIFTLSPNGRSRAISESAFKEDDRQTARLNFDQKSKKPLRFLSGYLFNPPAYYTQVVLIGYLNHFSPTFLFINGDQIGRHSQVDMGQIYLFDAIFLFLSFSAYKKLKGDGKKIMLFWLLLAPIPASFVTPTPHAQRALQMSIPLAFLSSLGAYYFFSAKKLIVIKILLAGVVIFSFAVFIHLLFVHYPKKFAADWQDGYRQMVQEVKKYQDDYPKVYITNINNVPYIYLLLYLPYDPEKFVKENSTKGAFGKYVFIDPNYNIYNKGRVLYVAPSWQKEDGERLSTVNDSSGRHIYSLWDIGGKN